ncbi:MAG: membrane protein insertion efficiency factor YidD [Candidatus Gygaella obscura]|nr:membrane protein insertion efficiency factor YidD [Candidatus Gygaella obscura]
MFKRFIICLIGLYQQCCKNIFLPKCRFIPSCSNYTKEAIAKYGVFKGSSMAAFRILRCNPFNKTTGWDPVK